ncbi:MAG: hypothetical protein KC549_16470, partial [Myxococcales bacterium]|nr:hypothetical protein [Myxococcales bacterium]
MKILPWLFLIVAGLWGCADPAPSATCELGGQTLELDEVVEDQATCQVCQCQANGSLSCFPLPG